MPLHLKKSINQALLENGKYDQIVSHLEKELELNGLETPDQLKINTGTQQATQQNSEKSKSTCHHCKKPGRNRNQRRQLNWEKDQAQNIMNSAGNNSNNNGGQTNSNSNINFPSKTNANNTNNQKDKTETCLPTL